MRAIVVVVLKTAALAWLAVPAAAKEGVEATLETPLPLDAQQGEQLRLTWTLGYLEDDRWQPITAEGVFIRLLSLADGEPSTVIGNEGPVGQYSAEATVPEGGIGGPEIGVHGTSDWMSDLLVPITNSPFPPIVGSDAASTLQEASAPAERSNVSGSFPAWLIVVLALAFVGGAATLGAAILRRNGSSASEEA